MANTFEQRLNVRTLEIFERENLVTRLLEMPTWMPEAMEPGCLFLLARRFQLSPKRDPRFTAVLACPQCGALNMITETQYVGHDTVICDSELCGQHFHIRDKSWFEFLPVH